MSAVCTDESVRMLVAGPGKFSHEKQKAKIPVTMTELKQEVSLSDIYKAKMRIDEFYQSTPCTKTCFGVDFGIDVTLKEENLSPTGSYFDRAVLNALLVLPEDQRRRGVITASECRPFIRALFHYGPKFGIPVTLVVPLESEIQKHIWSQPGRVIVCCGNDMQEAKRCAAELSRGVRLEYIDSDHSPTMLAGLGTLGLEILEQCGSKFDAIIVPSNDKNLLTAIRCSVKSIFPHVRIIGILTNDKDLTRGSNLPTTSNVSGDILQVGNADVSQAMIRIFEEKGEDGITGLAAAMSANLTQLQNTRVVVVSSECLVPSLPVQLEQVINKGPAA